MATFDNYFTAIVAAVASVVAYIVVLLFYNLFLHPLRNFKGPLYMRATRLGYIFHQIRGELPYKMLELHKKYGSIVRIAPNEVAFADAAAWQDIQGHRSAGQGSFEKWQPFYRPLPNMEVDIVSASNEEHKNLRRSLAYGFSEKSMRGQEPIIQKYVNDLFKKLHECGAEGGDRLDLASWFNFTTFDIIGDLALGEPFGCLANSDYHPWVSSIFRMARVGTLFQCLGFYPALRDLMLLFVPKSMGKDRELHLRETMAKLQRRMDSKVERPDLIEGLLKKRDEQGLTMDKLQANCSTLIIGGSETTATLLSGATYLLATNPEAMRKAMYEVRSAFASVDEIDFISVGNLKYLIACLQESLRMYPPVPTGLPRIVPEGGATICGAFIPAGIIVSVHHWALYHNEAFFHDPFTYHPERFLDQEGTEFDNDQKDAFQPFHTGARACIGRNLANVEMRIILARLLFEFDVQLEEESKDWMDQKIWNLWGKGPLYVRLVPASR